MAATRLGRADKLCFSYSLQVVTLNESGEMNFGDIKLLPLGSDETAMITCEPTRNFDLGAGPGKKIEKEVRGGTVGLILDARGRPLRLPDDRLACQKAMAEWVDAIGLYPVPVGALV